MRNKWIILCASPLLLVSLLLSSCTCSSDDGVGGDWDPGGIGVRNYEIAYLSLSVDNSQLMIMRSNGSDQTVLADMVGFDIAWSPDKSKIAFNSAEMNTAPNSDIYVINADGTGQIRITDNIAEDYSPSWSPDGSQIAFTTRRDGTEEIYIMDANGKNQTRLTYGADLGARSEEPRWSPAGDRIAFSYRTMGGIKQAHLINADGTGKIVSASRLYDSGPHSAWSSDGTKIAYISRYDLSSGEPIYSDLYVANADGSNPTKITNTSARETRPTWSPRGDRIAFIINESSESEIAYSLYVIDIDGSNMIHINTENSNYLYDYNWSPDGSNIVFSEGGYIYKIDIESLEKTELASGRYPVYSPQLAST